MQFVRKISGFQKPSHINEEAFNKAIEDVSKAAKGLISSLETEADPKSREEEARKAKERNLKRFGKQ